MRHSPLASGLSPLVPLIFLLAVSSGSALFAVALRRSSHVAVGIGPVCRSCP